MSKENLSEEGKWFLKNLQKLQNDFAEAVGGQIVTTDKEGNLITSMSGQRRVCKLIQETEKGKKGCQAAFKKALSLVKEQKEALFMDCYAGFASLWVPIKINGEVVGSITGCGGRYEKGEDKEDLREKFSDLGDELGIEDKEDFVKAAIDEIQPVTEKEMKKRATRLSKLVSILAQETALKEVFEV